MLDIMIIFAKYFTPILVLIYTYISFMVFGVKPQQLSELTKSKITPLERQKRERKNEIICERKKNRMFSMQYLIIYVFHCLYFYILFLNTNKISMIFLGIFELLYLVVSTQIFTLVYEKMSKLLFNNMLMLMDIGFVMIARLSYAKAIRQFIIIIVGTALCLLVPLVIDKFNAIHKYDKIYAAAGLNHYRVK